MKPGNPSPFALAKAWKSPFTFAVAWLGPNGPELRKQVRAKRKLQERGPADLARMLTAQKRRRQRDADRAAKNARG